VCCLRWFPQSDYSYPHRSGGRTTVVIDKNGLSNTGVVSATVNGSSDNFVIKITESAAASEEVVKALMAEYSATGYGSRSSAARSSVGIGIRGITASCRCICFIT